MTIYVAAAGASMQSKQLADYFCDGTDDDVQINAALDGGPVRLSEDEFTIGAPITIPTGGALVGAGQGTLLKAKSSLNDNIIELDSVEQEEVLIRDLWIDGNKANQASGGGIYLDNTARTTGTARFYSCYHTIENVLVTNTKADGITILGKAYESHLKSCITNKCDGNGFNIGSPDLSLVSCVAGNSGLRGLTITGNDCRLTNCKAYYSGQVTAAQGEGFRINVSGFFANCHSEDNVGVGFVSLADNVTFVGCIANDNGTTGSRQPGFYFGDASDQVLLSGCYAYGVLTGENRTQSYGITLADGANNIRLDAVTYNNYSGSLSDLGAANLTDEIVAWS